FRCGVVFVLLTPNVPVNLLTCLVLGCSDVHGGACRGHEKPPDQGPSGFDAHGASFTRVCVGGSGYSISSEIPGKFLLMYSCMSSFITSLIFLPCNVAAALSWV